MAWMRTLALFGAVAVTLAACSAAPNLGGKVTKNGNSSYVGSSISF